MNDMRVQQQQQLMQLQNGQRNSNFSAGTIVKKRNNTGGSFSLAKNEIDNDEDLNVNKNGFVVSSDQNNNGDDSFQQSAFESQYPEDMIDVQVIAKMQEESNETF
jgi:hypothetical protein